MSLPSWRFGGCWAAHGGSTHRELSASHPLYAAAAGLDAADAPPLRPAVRTRRRARSRTQAANSSRSRSLSRTARDHAATRAGHVVAVALEVVAVGQLAVRQGRDPLRPRRQQHDVGEALACAMAMLQRLVEPPRHDRLLEVRIEHQAVGHGRVVQVQVVVGDAAVPVGAGRRAGDVVHGVEPERDRAAREDADREVVGGERRAPGAEVMQRERQRLAAVGEHHAFEPRGHRAPAQQIGREGGRVAERRTQPSLASQQMAAAAREHMQTQTRVRQHFMLAAAETLGELRAEHRADVRRGRRASRQVVVLLVDVVVRHLREGRDRIRQARRRHPPRADRRAEQMHAAGSLRQPPAEDELVERHQRQPLRAAGRGRDHAHVVRRQAPLAQQRQRPCAGVDRKGAHRGLASAPGLQPREGFGHRRTPPARFPCRP